MKHAFILTYYFLLKYDPKDEATFFCDSIRQVIQLGGDTDTNAAIVGGMLGALLGLHNIPVYMIDKVMSYDCTQPGQQNPRPEFLSINRYALRHIEDLMNVRPDKLTVVPSE